MLLIEGNLLTLEAHPNGRVKVALTIWLKGTEETLISDAIDVVSDDAREGLVEKLVTKLRERQREGLPEDRRGEADRLLLQVREEASALLSQAAVGVARGEGRDSDGPPPSPAKLADPEVLLEAGREVLDAQDILSLVGDFVSKSGWAGETDAPKVVYLALASRLLQRPVNLFLSGPSSAGKNHAVKVVLPLLPPEAYYPANGQSPLAPLYSKESLAHRTLIVSEASALHTEGIGVSILRGLAWDAELNYDTVIDGEPVHLHKDGPTGLISTGTKEVEEELGTRMWTVPIPDDPDQTRKVFRATGRSAEGHHDRPTIPAETFIAAQRWLAAVGEREVVIPFAGALAELVPNTEVRARRDFTQLLMLISCHAMLHQRHRERDAEERIVSTLADYETVRKLVEPLFATSLSAGLDANIRATVEAVAGLITSEKSVATVSEVAAALKLSDSAAWRRVGKALRARFLVNDENRPHQPAKLRLGDPLPRDDRVLPTPDEIAQTRKRTSQDPTEQQVSRLPKRLRPGGDQPQTPEGRPVEESPATTIPFPNDPPGPPIIAPCRHTLNGGQPLDPWLDARVNVLLCGLCHPKPIDEGEGEA